MEKKLKQKIEKALKYVLDQLGKEPKGEELKDEEKQSPLNNPILYGWVARHKNGSLELHSKRPYKIKWLGCWTKGLAKIPPQYFPNLKWEDDAIQVEIKLSTFKEKDVWKEKI